MEKNPAKNENQQDTVFRNSLYKWLTPGLITLVLWGGREYYVRLDTKLDVMMQHIYKDDSAHMHMNWRIEALEKAERDRKESEREILESVEKAERQRREGDTPLGSINEYLFIKPKDASIEPKKIKPKTGKS